LHWIDWCITLIPLAFIVGLAIHSRKYIRGVVDFLAAGRVAGRYVISVGDLQSGLGVIFLVAMCESQYQAGMALSFWYNITVPLGIFMALTGYCLYRFRQTKCLSMGQFLELRYNRPFRVIAAFIRTVAEMMTNAIGPAVAARFFIYILGLPLTVHIWGMPVSTLMLVMLIVLALAMLIIWPGGRVSLLVTDAIQGLMSYPIFVIFTVMVLSEISWSADVCPVMLDRVSGESFLNPNDINSLRDFNLFSLVVMIVSSILNRAAWIGNDTSNSGRNAHEQKMAGVLGAWRNGFATLIMTLIPLFMVTIMLSARYSGEAKDIRTQLVNKAAEETITDSAVRADIAKDIATIPPAQHRIGVDQPYSRINNPDAQYLATVHQHLSSSPEGNTLFQQFRTLYYQMMCPMVLRAQLPVGIMGLFILLMLMLLLATDNSRIFNASATLIQDVVMPLRKIPFDPKQHLNWLRGMSVGVGIFFLAFSLLFTQMDYIAMFISIMCSLWLGAAGPIMVGGLYTRFGTTTGAFCALIFGSGASLAGIILQQNWSGYVYPWLYETGNLKYVSQLFSHINSLCSPYIVWEMNPVKFPINSFEIYFLAMLFGCGAYVIGSLLTCRKPFNLDRMLHRGVYSDGESLENKTPWTWKSVWGKLVGIDDEYTTGDKIIAWSVFWFCIMFQFGIMFVVVAIWNWFSPWPASWWSMYFYINIIVVGVIVGVVSTVWFMVGGIIDMRRLYRDLAARVNDPLDDGWVEGHVSRSDKAKLGVKAED